MIPWVNKVSILFYSIHESKVRVAVFETRDDLQNTQAIENRRIVWTCVFKTAGSKAEGSISHNYRFNIVTRCTISISVVVLLDRTPLPAMINTVGFEDNRLSLVCLQRNRWLAFSRKV